MIRKTIALAAAVAALAAASPALAQQREGAKIGLGLGLNLNQLGQPASLNFTQIAPGAIGETPVAIYVPVQVGPNLRIEPWLGFWTWSANGPASAYVWDLGVGALWYFMPASPTGLYLGGRLALTFSGGESTTGGGVTTKSTETDFRISGVVGIEHFIAPKFSLGAEAQLGPTFYGDVNDTTLGVTTTVNRSLVGWQTNGVIFVRYFF